MPAEPGSFIYPFYLPNGNAGMYSNSLLWSVGSKQTIKWNTTLDSYYVGLYHQQLDTPQGSGVEVARLKEYIGDGAGVVTYTWEVQTYDTDVSDSPVFYFWVNPGDNGIPSSYWNVTGADATTSSTTSAIITSSTSSLSTTATSPSSSTSAAVSSGTITTSTRAAPNFASATPTSETATTPSKENAPPSTLPIGLGVGLGVGIPMILAIGVWLGITAMKQRRNRSRANSPNLEVDAGYYQPPPPFSESKASTADQKKGLESYTSPVKEEVRYEAPGHEPRSPIELG